MLPVSKITVLKLRKKDTAEEICVYFNHVFFERGEVEVNDCMIAYSAK